MSRDSHKKRSRLDGLHQARKSSRPEKEPPLQTRESYVKELPIHSGDPNRDGVVEFELKLGLHEWGRFLPAPFMAHYYFTINNSKYEAPPTGKTKKVPPTLPATDHKESTDYAYVKRPVLYPVASIDETLLYLPPELGLSALYNHVEVYINGMKIGDDTDMMNQNKVYQALNRIYATKKQRTKVNQDVLDSNDALCHPGVKQKIKQTAENKPVKVSDEFYLTDFCKALQRSMGSESWMKEQYVSNRFAMDGNFGVAPPFCNALSTLRHQEEGNMCGFLPPGTVIVVRLHPRYPKFSLVQHLKNEYKYAFNQKDLTKEVDTELIAKLKKYQNNSLQISFTKFVMCYESVTLPDDISNRQLSRTLNYPFNRVLIDICSFEANHQQVVLKSRVPAGAKAAFVVFMIEEHLWYNASANKNLANYFRIPTDLTRMSFHLTDHGQILSQEGLNDITAGKQSYSFSLSSYYENYISGRGITDVTFNQMFPRIDEEGASRTQSLFLDLRQYYIRNPTQLTITCDFVASLSPVKTKLVVCYITDSNLKRSSNGTWTLENVM